MRTTVRIKVRRLCPSHGFRQDVSRRVVVPVGHVPARKALMRPDRGGLLHNLPAIRAQLRGEVRRYLVDPNPSTLGLEFEDVDKLRPPSVGYCPGEVVVLDHVAYPKIFQRYYCVPINVVARRLVRVVLALPGDLEVLFGNGSCSLLASPRALLAPTELALCSPELLGRTPEASGVLDSLAFGVGQEHLEADIRAYGWTVFLALVHLQGHR